MECNTGEVADEFRFERKFIIPEFHFNDIVDIFKCNGCTEIYQKRSICNIYLDDITMSSAHDNIEGNHRRLKHRIRWYGQLFGSIKKSKLEQKIKVGHCGKKRLFALSAFNLDQQFSRTILTKMVRSLLSEISSDVLYKYLFPTSINTYERVYYVDPNQKLRITFDQNIRYYDIGNTIGLSFSDPHPIVEIKYANAIDINKMQFIKNLPFRLAKNSKYLNGLTKGSRI